jgi:hypothetical protein
MGKARHDFEFGQRNEMLDGVAVNPFTELCPVFGRAAASTSATPPDP